MSTRKKRIANSHVLIIQQWTSTKRQPYPGSFIHFSLSFLSTFFGFVQFEYDILRLILHRIFSDPWACHLLSVIIFGKFLFITSNILYILCICGGVLGGSDCEKSVSNAGEPGLIPGSGNPLQEGMATHSSTLAWRIPWTEEPGGLQSVESQRMGHDWEN